MPLGSADTFLHFTAPPVSAEMVIIDPVARENMLVFLAIPPQTQSSGILPFQIQSEEEKSNV
jgi:hypothetical protein